MAEVELRIVVQPGNDDIALPKYMSAGASGMDICAAVTEPLELAPGMIVAVPTALSMAVPQGYEIQVRPRSGLALKHGITVVNSPGTIDADYRGEVKIILGNVSTVPFTIERGMRIAQLVIQKVHQADIRVVTSLDETQRGAGGFGSSGVR